MKNITTSTKNRNQRTFCWGRHNTRAQTARTGCSLATLLVALALAFLTPRVAMGALLNVDVGAHSLIADSATPQTIFLSVNNSSGSPITVGALNFFIQLGNGAGTTPFISSVDLLTGTIFSSGSQAGDSGNGPQSQFYAVLKAGGSGPVIPTGSSQLATISFVTVGTTSGSFSLSLSSSGGSTDYFTDTTSPTGIGLSFTPGSLDLVAVPEPVNVALPVFGGLVALGAGYRWWYRRKASSC
jgi:hypothetical protein